MEVSLAALFGLLFGSFLNVCIYRWPRDLSVVWPGSHCTACAHPIRPVDNIPVLSYVFLHGRCRWCLAAYSWRYPVVEALTAASFAGAVYIEGWTLAALKLAVFSALQIGLIFADLETRLLPDQFTKGGVALGLIFAALAPNPSPLLRMFLPEASVRIASLWEAAFSAAVVSGALWLIGFLYQRIRGREGLGFGDVKMAAMIGAFLGLGPTLVTVFIGCVLGTIVGIISLYVLKKDPATYELPLATFLGVSALFAAFFLR